MICHICHTDKALCLFTPREAESKYHKCRQCTKEQNKKYQLKGLWQGARFFGSDSGLCPDGVSSCKKKSIWRKTMKVHFREAQ